jgi:hypothetical protein
MCFIGIEVFFEVLLRCRKDIANWMLFDVELN